MCQSSSASSKVWELLEGIINEPGARVFNTYCSSQTSDDCLCRHSISSFPAEEVFKMRFWTDHEEWSLWSFHNRIAHLWQWLTWPGQSDPEAKPSMVLPLIATLYPSFSKGGQGPQSPNNNDRVCLFIFPVITDKMGKK